MAFQLPSTLLRPVYVGSRTAFVTVVRTRLVWVGSRTTQLQAHQRSRENGKQEEHLAIQSLRNLEGETPSKIKQAEWQL